MNKRHASEVSPTDSLGEPKKKVKKETSGSGEVL